MPCSLPERTVDSWVSVRIAEAFPHALIWSPTQRLPDNWDMAAEFGDGKLLIFENKGSDPPSRRSIGHRVWINTVQLDSYIRRVQPQVDVFYVLPDPPWPGEPTGSRYVPIEAVYRATCGDWLWVMRADDLRARVRGRGQRWVSGGEIPTWPQTISLTAFLAGVRACQIGVLLTKGDPGGRLDTLVSGHMPGSALAAFIPVQDLTR